VRLSRAVAVFGSALWLYACNAYFNDFDIINGTKVEVRDLSVTDGASVWKLGNLSPGGKTTFHGHLSGEAVGIISWTINGKRYSGDGCLYTVGGSTFGSLSVVGDHLEYRCT
jgi:hypothetical protein